MTLKNSAGNPSKYKKANGYYKFYNKLGVSCRIKTEEPVQGSVIIKFKDQDETKWMYHAPSRTFNSTLEVVHYILMNLESKNLVFKIMATQTIKQEG